MKIYTYILWGREICVSSSPISTKDW